MYVMFKQLYKKVKRFNHTFEEERRLIKFQKKLVSDFIAEKSKYEMFLTTAHKLVEALLIQGNYKYQLHTRVKDPLRLEEKLKRKYLLGKKYKVLSDVEDLAGLRIIFYTESDKNKFIQDLKKEAVGVTSLEEKKKRTGYSATHIIMSFGEKRLALTEYKPFYGLKCEVQITSAIYHAWSEVEHDIIYKDINGLEKINPQKYRKARNKLEEVLEKHIKIASLEFDEIMKDLSRE